LRVELLSPQAVADGGRLRTERLVECICQRMRGVGAHDQRPQSGIRTPKCGRGRGRGLTDAAFACEQQDSHPAELFSTWAFSSRRALCMIFDSARRFTNAGRGTMSSTVSVYSTSVRSASPSTGWNSYDPSSWRMMSPLTSFHG